ncbi:GIY-YIG nuclease family protein [Marivirga sericea]|uniref:GIY-YIG nuclease family protein n=1 Tax=Marivirga sericea TaxID=1028 RepID=UPI001FE934D0|nr:GIY-YIG nuclease family protein [Marivirga sericea]
MRGFLYFWIYFKFILFTVYAIKSSQRNYIYKGLTQNLKDRINRHNAGKKIQHPAVPLF